MPYVRLSGRFSLFFLKWSFSVFSPLVILGPMRFTIIIHLKEWLHFELGNVIIYCVKHNCTHTDSQQELIRSVLGIHLLTLFSSLGKLQGIIHHLIQVFFFSCMVLDKGLQLTIIFNQSSIDYPSNHFLNRLIVWSLKCRQMPIKSSISPRWSL